MGRFPAYDTLVREVKEETGLEGISEFHPFTMVLTDIRIPNYDDSVGLIFFMKDIAFKNSVKNHLQ